MIRGILSLVLLFFAMLPCARAQPDALRLNNACADTRHIIVFSQS